MATTDEQIQKLDAKIAQLQARKRALNAREHERKRRERTHRIIQLGAVVESALDCEIGDKIGLDCIARLIAKNRQIFLDEIAHARASATPASGKTENRGAAENPAPVATSPASPPAETGKMEKQGAGEGGEGTEARANPAPASPASPPPAQPAPFVPHPFRPR